MRAAEQFERSCGPVPKFAHSNTRLKHPKPKTLNPAPEIALEIELENAPAIKLEERALVCSSEHGSQPEKIMIAHSKSHIEMMLESLFHVIFSFKKLIAQSEKRRNVLFRGQRRFIHRKAPCFYPNFKFNLGSGLESHFCWTYTENPFGGFLEGVDPLGLNP